MAKVRVAGAPSAAPAPPRGPAFARPQTQPSPSATGPSSFSSTPAGSGPKSASGRSYNEQPSPAVIVEGQKALDDIEQLVNGARDYTKGGEEEGEDAADCLKLERSTTGGAAKLVNDPRKCPFEVETVWCTEGLDCKPTFSNMGTIGPEPDKYMKVSGTSGEDGRNAYVRWGACRGRHTIHQNGMPPLRYYCTKEHR